MIGRAVWRAIGQIGDPRFARVLLIGAGFALALLAVLTWMTGLVIGWLVPDGLGIPWVGEIASGAGILLMAALSVFLMAPLASVIIGFLLDDVADAVEDRHYPEAGPPGQTGVWDRIVDALRFLVLLAFANILALMAYLPLAPVAPLIFYALNGYLLGREYFTMIAMRRLDRRGAVAARKRGSGAIWLTGVLMAAALTIPVANLIVPILGAATFTHLYHLLEDRSA